MLHGDPAHGTAAPAVEAAKLGEGILAEAPPLTAVEQNQHEDRLNLASEPPLKGEVANDAR